MMLSQDRQQSNVGGCSSASSSSPSDLTSFSAHTNNTNLRSFVEGATLINYSAGHYNSNSLIGSGSSSDDNGKTGRNNMIKSQATISYAPQQQSLSSTTPPLTARSQSLSPSELERKSISASASPPSSVKCESVYSSIERLLATSSPSGSNKVQQMSTGKV